jgi:hypothetical protein
MDWFDCVEQGVDVEVERRYEKQWPWEPRVSRLPELKSVRPSTLFPRLFFVLFPKVGGMATAEY